MTISHLLMICFFLVCYPLNLWVQKEFSSTDGVCRYVEGEKISNKCKTAGTEVSAESFSFTFMVCAPLNLWMQKEFSSTDGVCRYVEGEKISKKVWLKF